MDADAPNTSRGRKRSSAWIANGDVDAVEYPSVNLEDTPSKRLLNNRGEPVQTGRLTKYNVQKLLNHLAFTRVYVTANFHNYNPSKSSVILCVVAEQDELYHTLWFAHPSVVTCRSNTDHRQSIITVTLRRVADTSSACDHGRLCRSQCSL
jgi:hypothetical protein